VNAVEMSWCESITTAFIYVITTFEEWRQAIIFLPSEIVVPTQCNSLDSYRKYASSTPVVTYENEIIFLY
jgi:hypothetical protein